MEQREFKATKGLARDTMTKQSGDIEKAVLEAVMNSVDADADEIDITIHEDEIIISDNGTGFSYDEVDTVFEKLGHEDGRPEDKEFGKFRIGRGQMFNYGVNVWHTQNTLIIVDIHGDETRVHRDWFAGVDESELGDLDGDEVVLESGDVSFWVTEVDDHEEGTYISIQLYDELDNIEHTANEVEKLVRYIPWLHDVTLSINDEDVYNEPVEPIETDTAYHTFGSDGFYTRLSVYNKGAYVKRESDDPVGGDLITKDEISLTMSRQQVAEDDTVYDLAMKEREHLLLDRLINRDERKEKENKWLLKMAAKEEEVLEKVRHLRLIEDINGEAWSLSKLSKEKVTFAKEGDGLAEDAMQYSNIVAIQDSYEDLLHDIISSSQLYSYNDVIEQEMKHEMKEVNEDEISPRRAKNLARARWFLDQLDSQYEVKPGHSKHQNIWKKDNNEVFIDRGYLNKAKDEFCTTGVIKLLEVVSHRGDTRQGLNHDYYFEDEFSEDALEMGEPIRKLLNGSADIDA